MSTLPRSLGRHGIKVSPLTLGTMMFGAQTDDATAARITERALDQGVNFIDTANVYNGGQSEVVVGRLIAPQRARWVLATKLGNPDPQVPPPHHQGASRNTIIASA